MAKFIIGYADANDMGNTDLLVQYATAEEADYETEEWCEVEADSLQEAKDKYEDAFDVWQAKQNEK